MRKIFYVAGLLLSFSAKAGDVCGSKIGLLNEAASEFLIPDEFPPETPLLYGMVSKADRSVCERISKVKLSFGCSAHDRCYQNREPKSQCDKSLHDMWVRSCRTSYYHLTIESQACRLACESFVKIMSEAQSYDSGGICPSCDSYNAIEEY
jgi:hypothetical protein